MLKSINFHQNFVICFTSMFKHYIFAIKTGYHEGI